MVDSSGKMRQFFSLITPVSRLQRGNNSTLGSLYRTDVMYRIVLITVGAQTYVVFTPLCPHRATPRGIELKAGQLAADQILNFLKKKMFAR